MAHIVNGAFSARTATLTGRDVRRAKSRLARQEAKHPTRRVVLACEIRSQLDATAVVGDHVWCDNHDDFAPVVRIIG